MKLVNSLDAMESIVNKNRQLSWDGWTVVNSYASEKGRTSKNGALVGSKWHLQQRFVPGTNGWDIPQKFAG